MLDIMGVMAFTLITVAFGAIRAPGWFAAVGTAVIVAGAIVTREARTMGPDWAILVAGLGLYSFGLLVIRTMLRRSVSLRLLAAYAADRSPATVGADIAHRVAELGHYGVAARSDAQYRLTAGGRLLAGMLRLVYAATRLAG